jgi:hypothetical protein
MKRVNLKQEFHGEPDMAEEGIAVTGQGPDEVTMDIKRGTLTLRVPSAVPDDQVISKENIEQFLQCVMELEDGSELTIILNEERDGVDVRLETPAEIRDEMKSASQLAAEKSPRVES